MGNAESRTIAYKEALSKFDQDELRELTITFKALAKHTEPFTKIDIKTFKKHFYQIEDKLAEQMFAAFVRRLKEKQPTLEDHLLDYECYVSTVAMCCRGIQDVKIEFIFELFDLQQRNKISKEDFTTVLSLISSSALRMLECELLLQETKKQETDNEEFLRILEEKRAKSLSDMADSAFSNGVTFLHFKEFKRWIIMQPQISEFIEYLLRREYEPESGVPYILQQRALVTPIKIIGKSELFTEELSRKLKEHLPYQYQQCNLVLLYSSTQHGYSYTTMVLHLQKKKSHIHNPSLLLVGDSNGAIFGGYASELWRKYSRDFYGNDDCFIFSLSPETKVYRALVKSQESKPTNPDSMMNHFMYTDEKGMGLGGTRAFHGLWLDEAFLNGHSQETQTFGNPCVSSEREFRIKTVEVWGFIDKEKTKFIMDDLEEDENQEKKSVLDNKEDMFMLDMLGKNYSSMVRD